MSGLLHVDIGYACCGAVIGNGTVVRAAPIIGWSIGKPAKHLADWVRRKGGKMVWLSDPPPKNR